MNEPTIGTEYATEIPIQFMISTAKYQVINWIADTKVPARIAANILTSWSVAVGVTLTAGDYELVTSHRKVVG